MQYIKPALDLQRWLYVPSPQQSFKIQFMVVISWFHAIRIKLKSRRRVTVKHCSLQPHSPVLTECLYVCKYKEMLIFLCTNIKYTRRSSHTGAGIISMSNNCTELHHSLNQSPMDGHQSFQSFAISHQATVSDLELKHIWSNSDKHDALLLLDILPFSTCGAHAPPVSPSECRTGQTSRSLQLWAFPVTVQFSFSYYEWGWASFHMF